MKSLALSTALTVLLAACGGGGGAGTSAPAAAPAVAVQITSANAQAVAAHATDTTQNTSAQGAASLVTGVQIDAVQAQATAPANLLLADAVVQLARGASSTAGLATGVAIDESAACAGGGSVSARGNAASDDALTVGDNVTIAAANCVTTVNGTTATISGSLSLQVTGGGLASGASAFRVVMNLVASNFSVSSSAGRGVLNGDLTIDLTRSSSTSSSLVITGNSLATTQSTGTGTAGSTWTGYRQSLTASGSNLAATLDATVAATNSRLGFNNASYRIATQVPVRWLSGSVPTSGVVVVTGAASSRLRITFTAAGVTLEVDPGNGTYGAPTATTVAALRALL